MKVLKYPLIPFTLFIAAGIITGCTYLMPLYFVLGILLITLTGTLIAYKITKNALQPKPYFEVSILLLGFSLGLLSQWIYYAPNAKSHYSHFVKNDSIPVFYGTITERLKPNEFYEKYLFEVKGVNKRAASGTLLLTLAKDSLKTTLHTGQMLFVQAKPEEIAPPAAYYQFDYSRYMVLQNVFHKVRLKNNYVTTGTDSRFLMHVYRLRDTLINSYAQHHYPVKIQLLINALVFGQRQDLDPNLNSDYTNAGVVHILAISGLHFALLFVIFNWLLSPVKRIKHWGTAIHVMCILALMWLFAFITGLSASVVRSVVMFSFLLVGQALNRRVSIYNSLAVSAMVLLLVKPAFLFDAGFQLSYTAVLGIVIMQPLYKRKLQSKHLIINNLRDLVMVSLTAQIAVLPLTLYYFHQFPLLFLVANIVVIPLSNVVLVLALVTLVLNFCWAWAAAFTGKLLLWCINIMNSFTHWIASFENLLIKNIPFTPVMLLLLYSALTAALMYLYKKSFKNALTAVVLVLICQCSFIAIKYSIDNKCELVVFQNFNHSIIAQKQQDKIIINTSDSTALTNLNVTNYIRDNFNPNTVVKPLQNFLYSNKQRIFIMDSSGIYPPKITPDILIIIGSPKVNFDRVLSTLRPKRVVADATNYKNFVTRWSKSCAKQKIPFHATAEKGSFVLE